MNRFGRLYLRTLSLLVPSEHRREWIEEWETELACRREELRRRVDPHPRSAWALVADASGALADASWYLREEWSLDMFLHDLRSAWRAFLRKPAFHLVAILTLALGIGSVTAIYSVFATAVLDPLPYPEPDRLVELWESNPRRGWTRHVASPANFLDWREQATSFAGVAAVESSPTELSVAAENEDPVPIVAYLATGNLFDVLGVAPLYGPGLRPEDTWSSGELSAVLSYGLWQDRLGGDPDVVGKTVRVAGRDVEVSGVMPRGFEYPEAGVDMWLPTRWDPASREKPWFRRAHFLDVVARLAPGVTYEGADAELKTIARRLEAAYPELNREAGAGLTPLHEWVLGDAGRTLWLLLATVALVLLIACANVVNLLLVRAGARTRELAIRSALGAGRRRLVRQLLTENVLIAVGAGLAGFVFGRWALQGLLVVGPDVPRLNEVTLDARVLAVAVGVTLVATLVFGLAPAVAGSRLDVDASLRQGGRSLSAPRRQRRARRLLVVAQVALALLVVSGAGLLIKSLAGLYRVDPGFVPQGLVSLRIALPFPTYRSFPAVDGFYTDLVERLAARPGVEAVAMTGRMPFLERPWSGDVTVEGNAGAAVEVRHLETSPGYFRTLGIPLVAGRDFADGDDLESERVVVVNDTFATTHLAGDPLGQRMAFTGEPDENSTWYTVVGVVGDVRLDGLRGEVEPLVYQPLRQNWSRVREVVVRTAGDPPAIVPQVRDLLRATDREVPLLRVAPMAEAIRASVSRERFVMLLLTVFGGVALVLAAVGTYGVVAVLVHRRRREIGIRRALGAERGNVVTQVVKEGMGLVLLGCGLGLVATLVLSSSLGSLLYEVSPSDPWTLAAVFAVLVVAGLVASLVPARRAARIDPVATLRCE